MAPRLIISFVLLLLEAVSACDFSEDISPVESVLTEIDYSGFNHGHQSAYAIRIK